MGDAGGLFHYLIELGGCELAQVEVFEVVEAEPDTIEALVEVSASPRDDGCLR